jgi:copper chaperone
MSAPELCFTLPDMTCEGCVRAVTGAIRALDPDATLTFDLPAHQVRIATSQQSAPVEAALRDAGFSPA